MKKALRFLGGGALVVALVVSAIPAAAAGDTTPPSLQSFTISPDQIDTSAASQTVQITAVVTDDLSGVCADPDSDCSYWSQIDLWSASGQQQVYGDFARTSGDTYTASLTFVQYAEDGVWRDWAVSLCDKAGNCADLDTYDLMHGGINIAVGVGSFQSSYARTVSLRLGRRVATGYVDASTPSACFWYVPVLVARRTTSGWKKIGIKLANYDGYFKIRTQGLPGKYRATAIGLGLGNPTVTTCSSAVSKIVSET